MSFSSAPSGRDSRLILAAAFAWCAVFLGIALHRLPSHARTTLDVYLLAGTHWRGGHNLYDDWRGFVYSPLAAVFFATLSALPRAGATLVWLALNQGALLGGFYALASTGVAGLSRATGALAFLLLAPLAIGNLDVMQANALVLGLLMTAFACFQCERWFLAALCVSLATYLKIYPLAVGLLFGVMAPRRFSWRFPRSTRRSEVQQFPDDQAATTALP